MDILERPHLNGATPAGMPDVSGIHTFVIPPPKPRRRRRLFAIVAAVLAFAIILSGVLIYRVRASAAPAYVTVPVARQDLVQTVSATGTVNPQNTISVGTQQSGIITEIDVDYNSKVHTGEVLARLDTTALQAQLDATQAQLAQAQQQAQAARANAGGALSSVTTSQAAAAAAAATARAAAATAASSQSAIAAAESNVTKSQSALSLAQATMSRDQALLGQGYISQSQADTDQSNLVAAQTTLAAAQSAVAQARSQALASTAQAQASRAQAAAQNTAIQTAADQAAGSADTAAGSAAGIGIQQAAVSQAETNLKNSVITSPVNGTVIARSVSVGQTVAASFQTPTLFSIAQDLNKMEVDLAVGEPDIGSVRAGEGVDFTVLAYPSQTFHGVVSVVRKAPIVTQNVVTYTTVVLVDNKEQKLLPGMTANATIDVVKQSNALVVPLAALSFTPAGSGQRRRTGGKAPSANAAAKPATSAAPQGASAWGSTTGSATTTVATGSTGRLFVERNGKPVRIPVDVPLVAGTQAAVTVTLDSTEQLNAGDQVIVGQSGGSAPARTANRSSNPFAQAPSGGNALRGIH